LDEGRPRFFVAIACLLQDREEVGPTTQPVQPRMLLQRLVREESGGHELREILHRRVRSLLPSESSQAGHRIEPAVEVAWQLLEHHVRRRRANGVGAPPAFEDVAQGIDSLCDLCVRRTDPFCRLAALSERIVVPGHCHGDPSTSGV
jgi:hypothetical protein